MTELIIKNVIKHLVLADNDDEIKSIAVVLINKDNEPELHLGMPHGQAYHILAGLEILKYNIIRQIINDAGKPIKDRE